MRIIEGAHVEIGECTTPDGTPYRGFKVTLGEVTDPASIKRTYDDIDKIFKAQPDKYKIHEEKDASGKFKSFSVQT